MITILKGNIVFTKTPERFEIFEESYLVVNDNVVESIYKELPSKYANEKITDYTNKLIIPGFVDVHVHAPQYENMGLGYDKELLPWLETYTFPQESKYTDLDFAKKTYTRFVDSLKKGGTTRAIIFATIHKESTKLLMDLLVENGIGAYVGKVNMDRNSSPVLQEKTEDSIIATEEFIKETINMSDIVKPIITPRFVPTCSKELMVGLGELSKKYGIKVQSHLSENKGEIEWVKSLHPECETYSDVYNIYGLFGQTPTIMAHCVHCMESEIDMMKKNDVFIAHCPDSNINLSSGIAPIREYMEKDINVGIGSDVSGGHDLFMPRAIVSAIQSSKLYNIYVDKDSKPLNVAEGFYLATKGGGKFFGKVGSFETGYEFDALVIDDADIVGINERTVEERIQKFIYTGKSENIVCRYVAGKNIDNI